VAVMLDWMTRIVSHGLALFVVAQLVTKFVMFYYFVGASNY